MLKRLGAAFTNLFRVPPAKDVAPSGAPEASTDTLSAASHSAAPVAAPTSVVPSAGASAASTHGLDAVASVPGAAPAATTTLDAPAAATPTAPAGPSAQPTAAPAAPAAGGSVADMLISALVAEFERQGFSSREQVASMTRAQVENVVLQFVSGEPDTLLPTREGDLKTALLPDVAEAGDERQCRALLAAGARPDARRRTGETALALAAKNGHVACVGALLGAHADPHASTPDGRTALHAACAASFEETALALVDAGASLSARSASGNTPLQLLSTSAYAALPVDLLGGAPTGSDAPWAKRPMPSRGGLDIEVALASAREAMAVRLARYATGALQASPLEIGRDPSFPRRLYEWRRWSPSVHRFFPRAFREVVWLLLLHARRGTGAGGLALLPPDLLLDVLRKLTRDDVAVAADERRAFENAVPKATSPMIDCRPVMLRGWPHVVAAADTLARGRAGSDGGSSGRGES